MEAFQDIEYHIELVSIKNNVNELIEKDLILIDCKVIFDDLKKAVINSNIKPFLAKPQSESNSYYDKYKRLDEEFNEKIIPDFFSHEGDFYDLDVVCNLAVTISKKIYSKNCL